MAEVNRNLAENFGLTDEQVAYRETSVEYVLDRLSVNAPGFVSFFKTRGPDSLA